MKKRKRKRWQWKWLWGLWMVVISLGSFSIGTGYDREGHLLSLEVAVALNLIVFMLWNVAFILTAIWYMDWEQREGIK